MKPNQLGQRHAQQGQGMAASNSHASAQARQQYEAAYNAEKQRLK